VGREGHQVGADGQFHSCKYGYIDIAEVAEVVANVSRRYIALRRR
jgi:hypothetical protein